MAASRRSRPVQPGQPGRAAPNLPQDYDAGTDYGVLLRDLRMIQLRRWSRVSGTWRRYYSTGFAPWRVGRAGSINKARLSHAIAVACVSFPDLGHRFGLDEKKRRRLAEELSSWWAEMLAAERRGEFREQPRAGAVRFTFCGAETFSPIYWGGSWIAEACALAWSDWPTGFPYPNEAQLELERSLRRHAAAWALLSTSVVIRNGKGRVRQRGTGTHCAGFRGKPPTYWRDANDVGNAAFNERPAVDRRRVSLVRDIARDLPRHALGRLNENTIGQSYFRIKNLAHHPTREGIEAALELCGDLRTAAPYHLRISEDGDRTTWIEWNANGNTAPLWAARHNRDDGEADDAWPYSHERVRGGTQRGRRELGRGKVRWDGPTLQVWNLTDEELAQRDGARRYTRRLYIPAYDFEIIFRPDAPPELLP